MSLFELLANTYLVGCLLVVLMFVVFELFATSKYMRHGWIPAIALVAGSWLSLGFIFYKTVKKEEKDFTSTF